MNIPPPTRPRLYGTSSTPPRSNQSAFGGSMPVSAPKFSNGTMPPQHSSPYPMMKTLPSTYTNAEFQQQQKLPFMDKLKRALSFSQKHNTRKSFGQGTSAWIAESPPSVISDPTTTTSDSLSFDDESFDDDVFICDEPGPCNLSFTSSDSHSPEMLQEIGNIVINKRNIKQTISNIHGRIELRETSIAALEKMLDFEKKQLKDYQNQLIEAEGAFDELCERQEKLMRL